MGGFELLVYIIQKALTHCSHNYARWSSKVSESDIVIHLSGVCEHVVLILPGTLYTLER